MGTTPTTPAEKAMDALLEQRDALRKLVRKQARQLREANERIEELERMLSAERVSKILKR